MGLYDNFRVIYNAYFKIFNLSSMLIDNEFEDVQDLLSFNNLLMEIIEKKILAKEDLITYNKILSFKDGPVCPICNTQKKGIFSKKCPNHKNIDWKEYAINNGITPELVGLLEKKIRHLKKNFLQNFNRTQLDILFMVLAKYFLQTKIKFRLSSKRDVINDPYRKDGTYTKTEYLRTLFGMRKTLFYTFDNELIDSYLDMSYEWTTYAIYHFDRKTQNQIVETVLPNIIPLIGSDKASQEITIDVLETGYEFLGISFRTPDLRDYKKNNKITCIADFSIYSTNNLEKIKTLVKLANYECTSEEILNKVLESKAPDYRTFLLMEKGYFSDYEQYEMAHKYGISTKSQWEEFLLLGKRAISLITQMSMGIPVSLHRFTQLMKLKDEKKVEKVLKWISDTTNLGKYHDLEATFIREAV